MKFNPRYIILLLIFILPMTLKGQYNPVYENYFLHQQIVNPATSGSEYFPVISTTYSNQWTGISHSPNSQLISGSFRMGNFNFYNPKMYVNKTNLTAYERVGVGFILYNDNEGPVSNRGGQMSYAFHIPLPQARLSLGLSANIHQFSIDESGFNPIINNDPVLHLGKESYMRFNSSFGAYYYSSQLFAGLAISDMLPLKNTDFVEGQIKQDFHLIAGYIINPKEKIKFEPSVYISYLDYSSLFFQLNTKVYLNHIHWINIHYCSNKNIGIKAGIKINRLYIAYGYEASLSRVFLYNMGTHEIHLGTNLGIRRLEGY
jgi:type IX secretion system PorP/SprF family membrane protein